MDDIGILTNYNEETNEITICLKNRFDMNELSKYYEGNLSNVIAYVELPDNRKFSHYQRNFFYALLGDIERFWGQPVDGSEAHFKRLWALDNGYQPSFSNLSLLSVEQANQLIDSVIEFMLHHNIPLEDSYKFVGETESWFYHCLMSGRCCICGLNSQKAHVQAVGMGMNRKNVDHTKYAFMALCGEIHHLEQHNIGINNFIKKYKIVPIYLTKEELKKIHLPVIESEENK